MGKITELYNSGEYETFIKLAENELNNTENDFEFFLALSNAYGNLGNYDKTFYYAEKLLEKEPTNYYALLALGNYYFVLEKLDSAEFYYNKVLSINPNYARANLNLAQLFVKKGEKNKAIEQYIKAIELFNQNNFEDEVLLYSKEVLKLDPENKIAKEYIDKLKM
ncbi:tetratricopeptide repeat protein [Draconibacterium sp.]|uniref:tetratricopeptide repeat protein n=1 Tax=Draconibacterium sp. TaxID=1965318 RepID=UPI003562E6D0